jgi:hypothetical protein
MSLALRSCVVLLAAATSASTADPDPQELFRKVRAKVLDDVSHVPRYTCVRTVNRAQYRPQFGIKPGSCRALIAARKQLTSYGYVIAAIGAGLGAMETAWRDYQKRRERQDREAERDCWREQIEQERAGRREIEGPSQ